MRCPRGGAWSAPVEIELPSSLSSYIQLFITENIDAHLVIFIVKGNSTTISGNPYAQDINVDSYMTETGRGISDISAGLRYGDLINFKCYNNQIDIYLGNHNWAGGSLVVPTRPR